MFSKISNVHRVHRSDQVRNNFLSVRTPLKNPTWRPQPREVKAVSHWEQSMMTRVTFRMNLIQPSKGIEKKLLKGILVRKLIVVRRSLVVQHVKHGLVVQHGEEMMQGRLLGQAVCLKVMKKYPHALKWQDIKDKIRNMAISDDRKWSDVSGRITKNCIDFENNSNKARIYQNWLDWLDTLFCLDTRFALTQFFNYPVNSYSTS